MRPTAENFRKAAEILGCPTEELVRSFDDRAEPAAWQWRYVGEHEWKTPSGGRKITEEELKRERPIEQRPLYAR